MKINSLLLMCTQLSFTSCQLILEDMIRERSLIYGQGVKGWWFDGLYAHMEQIKAVGIKLGKVR